MNKEHNRHENADIRVLRNRRTDLEQALSETKEDVQIGLTTQQHDAKIQHLRLVRQMQTIDGQTDEMTDLLSVESASQDDTISIGHVITIRINQAEPNTFVLVKKAGGQVLSGKTTLSSKTPVGNALIGRHIHDEISVDIGEERRTIEVLNCEAFANWRYASAH